MRAREARSPARLRHVTNLQHSAVENQGKTIVCCGDYYATEVVVTPKTVRVITTTCFTVLLPLVA